MDGLRNVGAVGDDVLMELVDDLEPHRWILESSRYGQTAGFDPRGGRTTSGSSMQPMRLLGFRMV
jgi:hypothetical protein